MTTTITPAAGTAPSFLHLGPGAADLYGAIDLRRAIGAGMQEGALSAGAYKVTAGGAMNVSIARSSGDGVIVMGDSITAQGLYYIPPTSADVVEAVTAAHATLPRIDMVVAEVLDAFHDGGASNVPQTRVVPGTATSGATLDNRTGAAALPATAMLLADVLVPAAAASIISGNIRDRRRWALGAQGRYLSTTDTLGAIGTGGLELTASRIRMECSSVPIQAIVRATGVQTSSLGGRVGVWMDGVLLAGSVGGGSALAAISGTSVALDKVFFLDAPTAASHLFSLGFYNGSGTGTFSITGATNEPIELALIEQVRQSTTNT